MLVFWAFRFYGVFVMSWTLRVVWVSVSFCLAVCILAMGCLFADDSGNSGMKSDDGVVRLRVGSVCGSGSCAGFDSEGVLIVTNAHVVGTQVGRVVDVDLVENGILRSTTGRIIWAAYSGQRLIDVAIVRAPELRSLRYRPMMRVPSVGTTYETAGHGRCDRRALIKPFRNVLRRKDSPLMLGDPDAVGGQSGSAIYSGDEGAVGVVTWSWGGRCAGQQTHAIHRLGDVGGFLEAEVRPAGLTEVADGRSETEDGIFSAVSVVLQDLPIWAPRSPGAPIDPNCVVLSPLERRVVDAIRQREATMEVSSFRKWIELLILILSMLDR